MKTKHLKLMGFLATTSVLSGSVFATSSCSNNNISNTPLEASYCTLTFTQGSATTIIGPTIIRIKSNKPFASVEKPTAIKDNCSFLGWSTDDTPVNILKDTDIITTNLSLTPIFDEGHADHPKVTYIKSSDWSYEGATETTLSSPTTFDKIYKPNVKSNVGKFFKEWIDQETEQKIEPTQLIDKDIKVVPFFQDSPVGFVTVSFDGNGGEVQGPQKIVVEEGTAFNQIQLPNAELKYNAMMNWCYDKEGTSPINKDTPIASDIKIYCHWKPAIENTKYLGIFAYEDSYVMFSYHGKSFDIHHSEDGGQTWLSEGWNSIFIPKGSTFYFKGNNTSGVSTSADEYMNLVIYGKTYINGNITGLINNGVGGNIAIPCNYCFYRFFKDSSGIYDISENLLPSTTLKTWCYGALFEGCNNLQEIPENLFKATTLQESCYDCMFRYCTNIKTIPVNLLNKATTMKLKCYASLFAGCTSITEIPSGFLSKPSTLAESCFGWMFEDCYSLKTIPENLLPLTNLSTGVTCYYKMFYNCFSLVNIPKNLLPATTLSKGCYKYMFYGCTSLINTVNLPAKTLTEECYVEMFSGCSSLVDATCTLSYTSVAKLACSQMFMNCSSLKIPPIIPKTTNTPDDYYNEMFSGCSSLYVSTSSSGCVLFFQGINYASSDATNMFYGCQGFSGTLTNNTPYYYKV